MPVYVGEGELGAGVGVFAAGDHPGPCRPARQVDQIGDLAHLGVITPLGAVGADRGLPAALGDGDHDGGDLGGQGVPDDEADLALAAGVQEPVRHAGGVGAGDHLDHGGIDGQLRERVIEDDLMIDGGARSGVAGTQQPSQALPGAVQIAVEGVEPEPVLVGRGRPLLVGVRTDQGGVDVDNVEPRIGTRSPNRRPRLRACLTNAGQRVVVDGFQGAPRRRVRRHLTEQAGLVPQGRQIRDRFAAIGDHHRQIDQHLAPVMAPPALLGRRDRHRQALGQAPE